MEDLNAVLVFLKVAELGGFVAAARSLGLPKSTVSLKVNELEQRLGVRLLHRTTRKVSLTEEGQLYCENCLPLLDALQDASDAIASLPGSPRGVLRVTAPVLLVHLFLGARLPEFLHTYPDLKVALNVTNERRDLVKEGYDVAIRVGHLEDSTLMMKRLSIDRAKLFASPAYLKTYGEPKSIADLKNHPLIGISHTQNELTWTLHHDRQETEVFRFRPRLASNDVIPLYQAVVGGLGIGLIPELLFQTEQKECELVNVLPQWSSTPVPINAIYSSHKHMPQKVKVFLDFLGNMMNANSIDVAPSPTHLL
jgi:LysR family transcriptional regulator, regulator for bpeEF and oprC